MFRAIPKNVVILGVVSFFNDIAAEMIYSLVPIFLTSVLHAPIEIVGLIEGVAEGTASLTKYIFGNLSDALQKRKSFAVVGYGLATISKVLIGLSYSWPFVLFARFVDRIGKGVRTAPRDAMLMQAATADNKGFIFGFHRAMDSAGAIVGPLLALVLLASLHDNLRLIFMLAAIPSVVGVILLVIFIEEKKKVVPFTKTRLSFPWKNVNSKFNLFFLVSIVFMLGNSSDAFILLRAKNLGLSTLLVTLTYVLYNVSQTVFAIPAGKWADKIGARRVFAFGLLIFAMVYFLFGFIQHPFGVWFIFPLYGVYIAFTDGVSKAYVAEFIEEKNAGSYFGLYQTSLSLATFFASFIAGILWDKGNPSLPFYYGAGMAILAFIILLYGKVMKQL